MECINSLFKKSQAETSTGSAPAEEVDVNATAAASTSSPPGEVVDVELELSHNEQPRDPSSEDHIREFLAFMAGRSAFTTNS